MPRPKSPVPGYCKHKASGQARVTINGRDYLLGPHGTKASKREYAKTEAQDFGPEQYKAVRQKMVEKGLTRQGVNKRMKYIVRMFNWAGAEGKIPASVFATLRLIPALKKRRTEAPESKPIKPVPQDVVDATLAHLSPIVADMVRVQLLIGCRPGEVCRLTPGVIDRSDEVWIARPQEHKTSYLDHDRNLYIGPKTQVILASYLLRGPDDCLLRPCDAVKLRQERDAASRLISAQGHRIRSNVTRLTSSAKLKHCR